ncbi:MAG: response regulator transcription factor [Flavobacteriaceae bacterium]|nr:response regulator transcription factor [Flavobacteriaceae bacterium]
MNILDEINRIVSKAKQNKIILNLEYTLAVFDALKPISTDEQLIEKTIQFLSQSQTKEAKIQNLTKRETEIFQLIGLGFSSREIGRFLSISEATVSTHRKKIIKKLLLSGPGQLQKMALQYTHSQLNK